MTITTDLARPLTSIELNIVQSLLEQTQPDDAVVDAEKFRARNHRNLEVVQGLENDRFILRIDGSYRPSLTAIAQLDHPLARHILDVGERLLAIMYNWYIDNQRQALPVVQLAELASSTCADAAYVLQYLFENTIWNAGRSLGKLTDTQASVNVAEAILRLGGMVGFINLLASCQATQIARRIDLGRVGAYQLGGSMQGEGQWQNEVRAWSMDGDDRPVQTPTTSTSIHSRNTAKFGSDMARVFFSYSHDDEAHRDQLEKHLATLKHQGLIDSWHDRRILAGQELGQVIDQQLEAADVILLLISASFLASDYCYGIEMARALQRHKEGNAKVIPVIVRPCEWQVTPLGALLAAPRDGKAITTWSNFDEAYADVARQVRQVVTQVQSNQPQGIVMAPPSEVIWPSQNSEPTQTRVRSSNLRLRKDFSEADTDTFLHDAFEYMARYFDNSLQELQARHPQIECRFRQVDANTFTAQIYRSGKKVSECAVALGGAFRQHAISYSHDAATRANSFNELLNVEHDDQMLFFKPMGMSSSRNRESKLSCEQASDFYWGMLIAALQ